jgi:hypothetical protein
VHFTQVQKQGAILTHGGINGRNLKVQVRQSRESLNNQDSSSSISIIDLNGTSIIVVIIIDINFVHSHLGFEHDTVFTVVTPP